MSIAALLLIVHPVSLHAAQSARAPRINPPRAKVEPPSAEDLFETGHDFCEQGEYAPAVWPLQKAVELSRNDPGAQLWLAHAMIQVGLVKEGKAKLSAIERSLSTTRPQEGSSASLYLTCARNYLGVMAAIEKEKPRAAVWFDKAAGITRAAPTPRAAPPVNRGSGEGLLQQEQSLRTMAEENKRLLEAESAFTAWMPPVLPLPPANSLKTGPGLAKDYIRAAEHRWAALGKASPRDQDNSDQMPNPPQPPGRNTRFATQARKLPTRPLPVQLLDASAALTAARTSAGQGNLDEALRLGEAARSLQPDSVDAFLLLADVYEAKNWLAEAAESLDAASFKATDDRKQAAKEALSALAENNPELAMEPRGLLAGKDFRIRFSTSPAEAQAVLGMLEQAYHAAARTFPVAVPVTYVRLFPDRPSLLQYTALAKGKPPANWMAAYARTTGCGAQIMTSTQAGFPALSHEYAHVVMHTLAGPGDLPSWLDEGIAQVVEKGRQLSSELTRTALRSNRLPMPDDIEKFFNSEAEKLTAPRMQVDLYYDTAHCVSSFLLNSRGDTGVSEWLLAIRRGEPARESFEKLFGLSWDQFFQLWAQTCLR